MQQFSLRGTVIDADAIERLMPQWEELLVDEMRQKGFARDTNKDPVFVTRKAEVGFQWELYMQGVYTAK